MTLTIRDRRAVLAALATSGRLTRSCPTANHIELFVEETAEDGSANDHWREVAFTREALAPYL